MKKYFMEPDDGLNAAARCLSGVPFRLFHSQNESARIFEKPVFHQERHFVAGNLAATASLTRD